MQESTWIAGLISAAFVVAHIAVCVVALGVIPRRRKPSTGLAWLFLILAVPAFGLLAFLLFGSTSVGRKRREWQRQVNERISAELRYDPAARTAPSGPSAGAVRLNEHLGSLPLTLDNRVEVHPDYARTFAAMTEAVRSARWFVHVEFYISAWDEDTGDFFDALVEAVDRGVEVRFLFDHLGSRGIPGYQDMLSRLKESGIKWAPMLPIRPLSGELRRPDLRNHRKILVVDGTVAFAGSQNLIEPGYNKPKNHRAGRKWVDLMIRVEGPAVRDLAIVFATDWYAETSESIRDMLSPRTPRTDAPRQRAAENVACQVVPSGPGFVTENNLRLFNTLIYGAQSRICLVSPYFVPDESLLYAVTTAAQSGVEVELFVNEGADQFMVFHAQRSYYADLLDAGVRIRLYPAPYVLHTKFFTVDDKVAVVGSSNMDYRSFALNYEVIVLLQSEQVVDDLRTVLDDYREKSSELTAEEWSRRGRGAAYVDNVMRLTSALQ
ncbi:cardiolipin synthase [Nocardioides sp. NPDC047086]|uniref:cardiolipin synthase n=1 Tax=Nocardioides sp. NPDC047086 TaxID=3154810 RepID=UPI0033FED7D4